MAQARSTLPSPLPATEIGLMTKGEFLYFLNPGDQHHPASAYDHTLAQMNEQHPTEVGRAGYRDALLTVLRYEDGLLVRLDGRPLAVIANGIAYYDRPHLKGQIPREVRETFGDAFVDLGITSYKQVKYLSEYLPLINPISRFNREGFPHIIQRLVIDGEPLTIRAEGPPKTDKGNTLVILNADGMIVAQAADEWGATLLMVAKEYRGKGLSKILGETWFDLNPRYTSGGFTPAGEQSSIARWQDRVREFSANGWYTQLVRNGTLTKERVQDILAGVEKRSSRQAPASRTSQPTGEILVYAEDDSFIVYDRAFLKDPDERFVHGHGFFRSSEHVGSFIFAIDYDRPFADLTTRVALQTAKDDGLMLYDGEGYHDLLEIDDIPEAVREGDYIRVTRDLIDVKDLARKERRLRKPLDPYDEIRHSLLEIANYKWR